MSSQEFERINAEHFPKRPLLSSAGDSFQKIVRSAYSVAYARYSVRVECSERQ